MSDDQAVAPTPDADAGPVAEGNGSGEQAKRRLTVELNDRSRTDLLWVAALEGLNRTTVVNRALQVYRMVVETQRNGGWIAVSDPTKNGGQAMTVKIV